MKTHLLLAWSALPCWACIAANPPASGSPIDLCNPAAWQGNAAQWATAASLAGDPATKAWKSIGPAGSAVFYNGAAGKAGNLTSQFEHGDVEAVIEFMVPAKSNSGVYFLDRYEIQILDSYGKPAESLKPGDCGGIYERWDTNRTPKGFEGTAPRTNAATAPGSWQTLRVQFRAPRFDPVGKKTENARFVRVELNGVLIHENVPVTGPTRGGKPGAEAPRGPIRLQGDHGPVAFRKLLLTPAHWE